MSRLAWFPWGLLAFRLALGPILLFAAWRDVSGFWLVAGLGAGILSDIVDGMLARRLGVATEKMRRIDSIVDTIFVLFAMGCTWVAYSEVLVEHSGLLALMLGLNFISYIPALIKFRRAPAYHAYSAKLSGLALFAAAALLLLTGLAGWWLDTAIALTILSHLDRIAITLLLPEWRTDVAGVWAIAQSSKN